MEIRIIKKCDYEKVSDLIIESFTNTENGYDGESELVDKIRQTNEYIPELELVAIKNDKIIGHGLLSEVYLESDQERYVGLVLAPIEVDLNYQKVGVGKILMKELEKRAMMLNYSFISIMGWPDYYSKFGYYPASKHEIYPPFKGVPDEAFMIKSIKENFLIGKPGIIKYSNAFE